MALKPVHILTWLLLMSTVCVGVYLCFTTMTIEAYLIKDPRARKIEQLGIAARGGLDSEASLLISLLFCLGDN